MTQVPNGLDDPQTIIPAPSAAEDFEILFPDVDVTVRDPDTGEKVVIIVREFRFLEGLHVQRQARGLIAQLAETARGDEVDVDDVIAALVDHADVWIGLLARATGREPEWIGRLSEPDGADLSAAMWTANKGFFVRRIVDRLRPPTGGGSLSPKSSTPSSGPGTDEGTKTSRGG